MKAGKPVAGSISKSMEKAAVIQRQMTRERERHQNKVASLAAQHAIVVRVADPALRAAKIIKLRCDETEENQRHRAKLSELERRAREVWR